MAEAVLPRGGRRFPLLFASSRPLLFILLILPLLAPSEASAVSATAELFPPSEDEYDMHAFDPRSMFGAPYGGYARATRSRLAKLPLRFVGDAGFDLGDFGSTGGIEAEEEEERGKVDGDGGGAGGAPKDVYFQMADDRGRQFVCRAYHQDELEPSSLMDGMFEPPRLRVAAIPTEDDDQEWPPDGEEDEKQDIGLNDDEGMDLSGAVPTESLKEASLLEEEERIKQQTENAPNHEILEQAEQQQRMTVEAAAKFAAAASAPTSGTASGDSQTGHKTSASSSKKSVSIKPADITSQVDLLKGYCAQIHQGWWSYEWCHEQAVSQFHVNVIEDADETLSSDGNTMMHSSSRNYEIESITSLGRYKERVIRVDDGHGGMPQYRPNNEGERGLSGSIVVVDTFVDGEWCEEASVHRTTEVELRCCPETFNTMKKLAKEAFKPGSEVDIALAKAAFKTVFEPPGETCKYKAKICTPLLCKEAFQFQTLDDGVTEVGIQGAGTTPTAGEVESPPEQMENRRKKKNNKKESIREILERTLGSHCLQRNAGWWTYEFCHTRHTREFHGANKLDMVTGVSRQVVEEENYLGRYDVDILESYPDEEEPMHVINATASDMGPSGTRKIGTSRDGLVKEVPQKNAPPVPSDAGGNGAVFVQEYMHGDTCEDPDVTDSLVKAGGIVDGGIERSTTVRFSCGKNYELVKVNEDSTCHYVFDVTVPALCKHPLFKAPVVKSQIVKCLPID